MILLFCPAKDFQEILNQKENLAVSFKSLFYFLASQFTPKAASTKAAPTCNNFYFNEQENANKDKYIKKIPKREKKLNLISYSSSTFDLKWIL